MGKRYSAILALTMALSILSLVLSLIALRMAILKPQGISKPQVEEVVEPCTIEGYDTCEAVRVFENNKMTQFYIRTEKKQTVQQIQIATSVSKNDNPNLFLWLIM